MLQPKKTKFRKSFRLRGQLSGIDIRGSKLSFGVFGLKAIEAGELTSRQIEAARKAIAHFLKRGGKIWIRVFPDKAITRKAAEVPMGAGKGTVEYYASSIKPGRIIFEMDGIPEEMAKEAMRLASYKLPVKCKFISSTATI